MSLAFVTGGSGFVGSNLVERLIRQGWRVRCLVRKASSVDVLKRAGADLVIGAVDQPESLRAAMEGVDVVFHVAGLTCALQYDELLRVNRDGAEHIVAAAAARPTPPPVVLVSSIAAGGPTTRGQVRLESDPPKPISQYGESKLAGEQVAAQLAGHVPLTIVRPGIVFGPRDRWQLSLLNMLRWFRFHPVPGSQDPPLSFIHIDDLSEVLIRAAAKGRRVPPPNQSKAGEGVYHGVVPEYPTWADWGKMMRPLVRRPWAPVVRVPHPVPMVVARCSEVMQRVRGKPEVFNRDKVREAQVDSWACSSAAIERDLGFVPPKNLTERLQETVDWYKANRWL